MRGMIEKQQDAVDAVLDAIDRDDDWAFAFMHADFSDDPVPHAILRGFLVVEEDGKARKAPFAMASNRIEECFLALRAVYQEAGDTIHRLDLTIEADGPFRFEFDYDGEARSAAEASAEIERRFEDLAASI